MKTLNIAIIILLMVFTAGCSESMPSEEEETNEVQNIINDLDRQATKAHDRQFGEGEVNEKESEYYQGVEDTEGIDEDKKDSTQEDKGTEREVEGTKEKETSSTDQLNEGNREDTQREESQESASSGNSTPPREESSTSPKEEDSTPPRNEEPTPPKEDPAPPKEEEPEPPKEKEPTPPKEEEPQPPKEEEPQPPKEEESPSIPPLTGSPILDLDREYERAVVTDFVQTSSERQLLTGINRSREEKGLGNISRSTELNKLARIFAMDAARRTEIFGQSPTYGWHSDFAEKLGFNYMPIFTQKYWDGSELMISYTVIEGVTEVGIGSVYSPEDDFNYAFIIYR